MIPDIRPDTGQWLNLYTLSGFTVGTRLLVQNKTDMELLVWEGAAKPVSDGVDDLQGYILLKRGETAKTNPSPAGVWVRYPVYGFNAKGRMCVQEYLP